MTFLSAIFALYPEKLLRPSLMSSGCASSNQFQNDTQSIGLPTENLVNWNGTVSHFKDDFSHYSQNSKVFEPFDNLTNLEINGRYENVKLSSESYAGQKSLSLTISPVTSDNVMLSIKKNLNTPLDLSRWSKNGIISMWTKLENRKGITGVGLKIGDKNNNYREFKSIKNLQIDLPNNFDIDDAYPDVILNSDIFGPKQWTDYWLNKGWNYLFWKADRPHFQEFGTLDMSKITWLEITFYENKEVSKQEILLDDLRIQDGIQENDNALGGVWYPPSNEPQNGVFELDKFSENTYVAKLLHIPETQYPGNNDQGRMVLNYATPMNFAMKTKFMLTNFPKNDLERVNTWLKIEYDFDDQFDIGNSWFASFVSFEWNKFGLSAFRPIEKDDWEQWDPRNEGVLGTSSNFTPKENTPYEIHLTVRGQKAVASIYEVSGGCLVPRATTRFTFPGVPRQENKRYPFSLETTGNVKAEIFSVEINEIP